MSNRPRLNEVDSAFIIASEDATDPITRRPSLTHNREIENPNIIESSDSDSDRESLHSRSYARSIPNSRLSRVSTQPEHPVELSRIQTHRSLHSETVGRSRTQTSTLSRRRSQKPLPAFGAGKPYPPALPDQEEYVVEFDGPDDPLHAQNWPLSEKIMMAVMLGFTTFTSSFTSSMFSTATHAVAYQFGVSPEVGILGTSLYVLGFAFGPTFWAPLSELKGRRLPIIISMFGFTVFCFGCATGKDLQTVLICRFFSGLFGACPLAVVAAVFSDMFDNKSRGIALTVFSMMVFTGPLMAPFIGGFIVTSSLGWRWTQYISGIMGATAFTLDLFFMRESYPPIILVQKATDLRRRTLNWGIHAKQEEIELDLKQLVTVNFTRPLRLLFTEPIVTLLSIYMSFIYGLLYLFLTAYPLVFVGVHHFTSGVAGLAFFGMIVGQLIAGVVVLAQQPWYMRKLTANNGVPVPEWRLPSIMGGSILFAIGLFWFGWTGYREDIPWIVPTLSGLCSGFGIMSIFLQALNYLVDAYLMFAASAIAGNTFMRSLCGAGFPLFATYMFNGMGIQWASTVLGCVATVLIPIPFFFYKYGPWLRSKSKFAPTMPMPGAPNPAAGSTDDAPGTANSSLDGAPKEHQVSETRDEALRACVPRTRSEIAGEKPSAV
ncbi:hypothetical protein TD95_004954 [Thielaviopsis punctulata]|uniref:Major facilitator superfamily (MFS) profile domain-containing protein n=1 Tax=Thielaviopsis punctulata TaxID=72032 RepID=A0A0F4ZKY2_9PEZI|nr:hypothetical protein TD95_004954 [Thielaviopsis punctulata]